MKALRWIGKAGEITEVPAKTVVFATGHYRPGIGWTVRVST
jgi:hypothetical protein